jgi:Tfp pilus assembly protein PilE
MWWNDMKTEKSKFMKGQGQMLEYVLLMVFIVIVILALIFFLTWWQISQLSVEKSKNQQDRTLSLIKQFLDSPYMTKENSMFDDGKLTALAMTDNEIDKSCQRLQAVYGTDWYAEIRLKDGKPPAKCDQMNYPDGTRDCNYWTLCEQQQGAKGKVSQIIPVNVYRNIGFVLDVTGAVLPRTYIGTLNVTVYV